MRMIISEVAPPDWRDCNKSKLNRESGHKWYHCITLCPIKYVNVPATGLSLLPDTVPGLPLVENQQKSVVSRRAEIWDQSARGLNRNITNLAWDWNKGNLEFLEMRQFFSFCLLELWDTSGWSDWLELMLMSCQSFFCLFLLGCKFR